MFRRQPRLATPAVDNETATYPRDVAADVARTLATLEAIAAIAGLRAAALARA